MRRTPALVRLESKLASKDPRAIRADLYRGQTCAFTGQLFVFRPIIGYYECLRVY